MLRRARPADAPALAEVQLRAWWHAYGEYVAHDALAAHTVASRTQRWTEILAAGETTTVVAEAAGRLAGFASYGSGELLAIYVDPPAQGAGVGAALLAAAEDGLRDEGHATAFLWVLARNELGRAFYASRGWAPDDPPQLAEHAWGTTIRYARRLR